MSNLDETLLLNTALTYCSIGHIPFEENITIRTFGYGIDALNIIGRENYQKFETVIDKLLVGDTAKKITTKNLREIVIEKIKEKLQKKETFSSEDGRALRKELKDIKTSTFRVFRDLFGTTINNPEAPIAFGEFTFYSWKHHKGVLEKLLNSAQNTELWLNGPHNILVEHSVVAGNQDKALELADISFARLESILRFMIGIRNSNFEIGVNTYTGLKSRKYYVASDNGLSMGQRAVGGFQLLPLEDNYFSNPAENFKRLIHINPNSSNSLDRKILKGAEWIAQALTEPNPASALIKAATTLEVLFSANERGIITPSIMAQISESCAHILGDSIDSCLEVERKVKALYGIRSAVVHSGKEDVNAEDIDTMIHYARQVILNLLAYKEYEDLKTIEKLQDLLRRKKYSYAAPLNSE